MSETLKITGLHVAIGGKEILKGVDLEIRRGEIPRDPIAYLP